MATPKKTAGHSGAKALPGVDPEDTETGDGANDPAVVKKKDLIDRVVAASGLKKSDVKAAVEAALAEMGAALDRGENLQLPPFGNMRVAKFKDMANATVLTCKLRRPKGGAKGPDRPLAEAAE